MAGGSDSHDTIALNLASLLHSPIRGSGCQAYISFDFETSLEAVYEDVEFAIEKIAEP
jgi:hypothetical protein